MNATEHVPKHDVATTPLHMVVAYDDPIAAAAARSIVDGLIARWAPNADTHCDEWSFGELAHPQCWQEALELARGAGMFVLAISGQAGVPESFVEWFEEWLESRAPVETALVLCLGTSAGSLCNSRICATLEAMAAANHLTFFAAPLSLPAVNFSPGISPKALLERLESHELQPLPESSGLND